VIVSVPQLPQAGGAHLGMCATINGILYPIQTQSEANHAVVAVATLRHLAVVDAEQRQVIVVVDILVNDHEKGMIVASLLDKATVGQHAGGLLHPNALRP